MRTKMFLCQPLFSQRNWVCDSDWKAPLSQAVYFLGAIFGTAFFGLMADLHGRFWAFFSCQLLTGVCQMVMPFVDDFQSVVILRFFSGVVYDAHFQCLFILGENLPEIASSGIHQTCTMNRLQLTVTLQPWSMWQLTREA